MSINFLVACIGVKVLLPQMCTHVCLRMKELIMLRFRNVYIRAVAQTNVHQVTGMHATNQQLDAIHM